MLRDGLFSSDDFVEISRGFTLLRLKPGPAEARFGITSAPNAALADWHGRVTVPYLNLRGDIRAACGRLRALLGSFDRAKASRPPHEIPDWARSFLGEKGPEAIGAFLARTHPRKGRRPSRKPGFEALVDLYGRVEVEGDLIRLSENLLAALVTRTPEYGKEYPGYGEEEALLRKITYCRNDRIKFNAIKAWAAFAPISEITFLVKRAEEKLKDSRNPNVVLCNSMAAIGVMAKRFPGVKDRRSALDREEILKVLPAMVEVLDTEGRNNGACRLTSDSLVAIVLATGAPEALEAYLHNLQAPKVNSDWMRERTEKYRQSSLAWLREHTGRDPGADFAAWKRWYGEDRLSLYFHPKRKVFVVDEAAAKRFRKDLAAAKRRK